MPARRRVAEASVRREGEADLVGNLEILRIGDGRGGDRGVDPHAALASVKQREILVKAVRARARRAGLMQILHADIGHGLDRWMVRVSRVDRGEREFGERRRLQVVGILIERRARAGRYVSPALLRGVPMVKMSNCPPLVAMSMVTR